MVRDNFERQHSLNSSCRIILTPNYTHKRHSNGHMSYENSFHLYKYWLRLSSKVGVYLQDLGVWWWWWWWGGKSEAINYDMKKT
jgi:hypothetical protein